MKFLHFFRILFLLALPLSFSTHGSASSLQGKVIEVLDGERITVISLNRPLKVKLVAIAAPVKEQPYADVATQHLSQLVSDKYVVVRYTSLDDDGYLLGRVTVNDMDVGEQMVRDGVAWYDKSQGADFSDQDRQAYFVCEQAARKEARGLWQDSAAVAPWEFRRQLAASRNIVSSQQTVHAKSARAGKQALSSDDIFSAM